MASSRQVVRDPYTDHQIWTSDAKVISAAQVLMKTANFGKFQLSPCSLHLNHKWADLIRSGNKSKA